MPDVWTLWDKMVDATGRPARVAEDLNDLELLNLLADDEDPDRDFEKRIIQQEVFRRMGHPEAERPGRLLAGERLDRELPPEAFSGEPQRGPFVDTE
jgi:hypothetical protein